VVGTCLVVHDHQDPVDLLTQAHVGGGGRLGAPSCSKVVKKGGVAALPHRAHRHRSAGAVPQGHAGGVVGHDKAEVCLEGLPALKGGREGEGRKRYIEMYTS
jgi:hypothetical protein